MKSKNQSIMSLRGIKYKEDYRSGVDDILGDFLRPALSASIEYWRAVGYFSSTALETLGQPLAEFIRNGGTIRLVTSVELSEKDVKAIESGTARREICAHKIDAMIDEHFGNPVGEGVAMLGTLLSAGRLEIKIAVPAKGTGIYHEKIGLFFDGSSDFVAFSGSSNESRNAFENNRECIDVYPSWSDNTRANRKRDHFEQLWQGTDKGVEIFEFPDAAKKKLIRKCEEFEALRKTQTSPQDKWKHQDEAISAFMQHKRGVLNMATGTGKTRTALHILRELYSRKEIDTVIITMDGDDLLKQWYGELLALRASLSPQMLLYRDFDPIKEVQQFTLSPQKAIILVSRRGGSTRDPLAAALRSLNALQRKRTLLIHDEVHRLGSPDNRKRLHGLSDGLGYALGLSATPERAYDSEGNQFITDHIGPELYRFELADAIRKGILAPFNYFPLRYELTDEDRARVKDVYKRQAARAASGEPMSEEQVWTEISKVYKTSPAKLPIFSKFIDAHPDLLQRCIIFVETMEYGAEVLEIIHNYRSDFHTYFSGEQAETLRRFAGGDLECLITCHRVSEGIDIRSLNSVILFSSARAKLETIQRMGRCLRINPDNPEKIANVVDFIRHNEEGSKPTADDERCTWLTALSEIRSEEALREH